ncbi:MAG TPA: SDR family NAD(P)-dependent oxidoreductase [Thermoanaerobaculia bacterium]
MIDFIEYVVSELKSKRLSKANAVALVRQFSSRILGSAAVLHPLLHRNTSDLSEQRYCSTFTGQEHFLTDHQVKAGDGDGQKVLPGVAYLEMARAAVEHSLPERPDGAVLELRNTVWAQPVVVARKKDVNIALLAIDDEQVDYEIYSEDEGQEFVHCQGRALWNRQAAAPVVDLEQLRREMTRGSLTPETVYATCARMGLVYGPSFRSIAAIRLGSGQLLAELRLPPIATEDADGFVLHPSLMDGALQAAVGLLEDGDAEKPRLPFALESLRVLSPCTAETVVWLRHAAGSQPSDKVFKLDIDLCDADGKVCVEMRGFSWRVLSNELGVTATGRRTVGSVLATPVWQARAIQTRDAALAECHVLSLRQDGQQPVARDFGRVALECFERIQDIFQRKPQGKVLLQVAVTDSGEEALFAGLSGLFRTAALENPQFTGQIVLVPAELSAEESARRLEDEKRGALDPIVRYRNGVREVLRWQEVVADAAPAPIAFVDRGVYLITGGFGGLGVVFAREILEKTGDARVVLTGREPLSAAKQAALDALSATPGRVIYRQLDLGNAESVRQTVAAIREECGRLDGILHSAGMIADDFILKKERAAFSSVLEPKVTGTLHLDEATRDVALDFFVLFSAVAGATGNLGQADYAAANSFMDHFAAHRNRQVAAGQRQGRTRAIDWPLWEAGGMAPDPASRDRLQQTTGMQPMHTATGLEAFHRILALPYGQVLVVEGDLAQIRRMLLAEPAVQTAQPQAEVKIDSASLAEKTQEYLRNQFSGILKVPAQRIDPRAALENYGIDSIVAMQLTNQLETVFGSLSKTLFFEYQTIRDLADYFIASHSARLAALFAPATGGRIDVAAPAAIATTPSGTAVPSRRSLRRRTADRRAAGDDEPIAIIGLSGRYPEAVDLEAYWRNLRDGKDCITEVPKDRWDWREFYSEDRSKGGHHYSKWGGFIEGVDEFDPLFFNISPLEAESIDPQERLFLQHAWMAIEDAGYTRAGLQVPQEGDQPGQVGVYAGVMYTEYQMFGAEALARGRRLAVPGSAASIANRVSYALNLHGPSMTLDTMCSSSLTAIHLACQDLKNGRTSLAIAGGVNVSIHPNKYLVLSEGQFISSDGHCQSFGEGGGGYIPGEGVGVVVLKRLSDAKRDGDHIYAIIRGSALTHGGKTNGYSVPNPQAQTSAISRALAESGTDARHISYIEAHGTGTKLGDPIEIAALNKAFRRYTPDSGYCLIGSAKSNIGHCESAAGIAGLTKVLLQMRHGQIVPSLHSAELNPHIDFPATPFIVNQTLRPWEPPVVDGRTLPRIAGISSFGAGGSNAHVIVEEYVPPVEEPAAVSTVAIVLSARTAPQLRQKASELLEFLRPRVHELHPGSLAYTLQVGREAMDERLGILVSSTGELVDRLERWLAGEKGVADVHRGQVRRDNDTFSLFSTDPELQQAVDRWIAVGKLPRLLELWVKGLDLDWSRLYGEVKPRRVSLPVYPFAKERYWIDASAGTHVPAKGAATAALHPLLHSNTSDFSEQRYSSTFTGEEPFLADHRVSAGNGSAHKVLPGVAYLEMARAAMERAFPERPASAVLELHGTVWAQPVVVDETTGVSIVLLPGDGDEIEYEIYTGDEEAHCQGRAVLRGESPAQKLELEQLRARMNRGRLEPGELYEACARLGLHYGPSFRAVTGIHRGAGEVLAELRLPDAAAADAAGYVLHPSLMDGALQAAVALLDGPSASSEPRLPFALETLRAVAPCTPQMVAWVRLAPGSQAAHEVVKLDVDLCDADGNVCVQMHGFSTRALKMKETGTLTATPVWQAGELPAVDRARAYAEHHVILCELPDAGFDASLVLTAGQESVAQRYADHALACFERIQSILLRKPQEQVLVQIAVPDRDEQQLFAGLQALLSTAVLENPQLSGQLVLVSPDVTGEELRRILQDEQGRGLDPLVRYRNGVRQVLRWQEIAAGEAASPAIAFKDDGVYLITGGLGGLGTLFAEEILVQTRHAKVVLTGRSARGADDRTGLLASERVAYRQVNLSDPDDVGQLVSAIRSEWGRLDGILHCAGMLNDGFFVQKTGDQFRDVLAPKVTGTWNLDQATRDVELDFFVLFSSIAGASGNPGQADYAAANAFLDRFAAHRNRQVAAGARRGRTRSINWPLWQAGGMGVDRETRELLRQSTGMQPMQTAAGVAAFHRALALPYDQTLVVEGDLARIRRGLLGEAARPAAPQGAQPAAIDPAIDAGVLGEQTREWLRRQLAGVLKLPAHKIDPHVALEQYGIDSILAMKLTSQLEKSFGTLPKTLFFEYQTIGALAEYFAGHHAAQVASLLAPSARPETEAAAPAAAVSAPAKRASRRFSRTRAADSASPAVPEPIAIIGLSGRYPQAFDLDAFWNNLREGKDCITEVPKERWDWREYFSEDRTKPGQHYSKWGGFIEGVDEFDPLFFNISPADAEILDPQERLFLQHAWMAMEDAGYTRASLQVRRDGDLPGQVGVYAGVMYNEYQLFAAEANARGRRLPLPGSSASIANRVSYVLNLHGPSMTVDTMCSSSLTAIHFACQDLALGRTSMAIAGGVNVSIHPNKYLVLSAGQFISSDGHCQSFGEGGDGYIPGEGVGVVILKRLSEARRDGDQIYGVIRGSAINHGGKTNGYTVPNPQAQASAIGRALTDARIDARHISYIEAHGTGTTLGDPIEIAALGRAFQPYTQDTGYCLIGSAKSNIGHCESAAGIAGLTKVLLQLRHREIVPSLHSSTLNPHIDFASTPFVVNQALRPWDAPVIDGRTLPRVAGISSFGAGGSNAHLIVEEAPLPAQQPAAVSNAVVPLSARTPEQLRQKTRDLLAFLRPRLGTVDLAAMAYTLQAGREPMEERLAFVVSSAEELAGKLEAWLAGEDAIEDCYQGQVKRSGDALAVFSADADLQQMVDKWLANGKLTRLLELWVQGLEVDWNKLHGEGRPRRISLPVYPFARERHWIDAGAGTPAVAGSAAAAVLHPLLHTNTSDLNEQRYRSTFTGNEFFLADHQVTMNGAGGKVLPGVAYLEMARAAIEQALPERPEATVPELHNVVWAQPIVVAEPRQITIALSATGDGQVDFEIYSRGDGEDVVHGQGRAVLAADPAPAKLDVEQLERQMVLGRIEPDAVYAAFARMGLSYGPTFRTIAGLHRGLGQVLAHLRIPAAAAPASSGYVLHPSLMDGALQAAAGLLDDLSAPNEPRLPFELELLRVLAPCTASMAAWVRLAPGSSSASHVIKLDIDLCDDRGNVCVQMRGLASRALGKDVPAAVAQSSTAGSLLATPVWQTSPIETFSALEFVERHAILCELAHVDVEQLASLLPLTECLSIEAEEVEGIAQRYTHYAAACFEQVQAIFQDKREGKVLVQIAIADDDEHSLFAGLSGLLKTAALENPQFIGQLILVPADTTAEDLEPYLNREMSRGLDALIKYRNGVRRVLRWQEVAAEPEAPPVAFKDQGVYLITGGVGGMGLLFAAEILERTHDARVVLTGRSALTPERQALLDALATQNGRVSYRELDLMDLGQVEDLVAGIRDEYGRLDGILHSAGMIADRFILHKDVAELTEVLAPKVTGTVHLDHATRDVELDFFVMFSSIAGAMGNVGQADYAAANGFMDQFAAYRDGQVAAKQRHGRTRSINWPLWEQGGMKVDQATEELLRQTTGMSALQTAAGLEAFHRCLASPYTQMLVVEGDLVQLRALLAEPDVRPAADKQPVAAAEAVPEVAPESLAEKTQDYLRDEFSGILKLPVYKIDVQAALEKYGIDSILAIRLTNQLEKTFGPLSKTLFFEYQTIAALAGYFIKAHSSTLREKLGHLQQKTEAKGAGAGQTLVPQRLPVSARRPRFAAPAAKPAGGDIAIVGLAGRYPQAENLLEFWRNLKDGRDCITEIPADRWDHDLYFDPDPSRAGKSYTKWGGFISDVDKFDPLFFNISPKEAELMDPQERLFLETAWETIEDAGYSREKIAGGRVGVFVGVMWGQYELFGAESLVRGNAVLPGSSYASIANRVSYFFDLRGPSIALDTMCSSSLTAIHLACEALRRGEIEAALAGGVNVSIHPYKYLSLSQGKFAATDGKCRSFGEGGDGYVPGEGVGAVLLKPLDLALRDGDQIYATIKSSSVNHGGKTNGYTVPNPNAQGVLIREALGKANIDPATLGYIETHGTGTSLGDPIEVTGLLQAFEGSAGEKQSCPIGSVKSNIGHLEAAAGIAAVTKALLQLRYAQLVPSLHADPPNPNINFADSPFYVQTELADWVRPASHPRRVGISSFGAGGSNAHLILEEAPAVTLPESAPLAVRSEAIVLSAKNPDALLRYAERILRFLDAVPDGSLADMAYTFQVGRTAMDARLAVIATTTEELRGTLEEWIALRKSGDASDMQRAFYGNVRETQYSAGMLVAGPAGKAFIETLLRNRDLERVARLWVLGADIDWSLLDRDGNARRVSLPTYPFAKERFWVRQETAPLRVVRKAIEPPAEEKRRISYVPQWTAQELAAAAEPRPATGTVLLLDASEELFSAWRELPDAGTIVLVKPGDAFEEIAPNAYAFDFTREEQFQALVAALESKGLFPDVVLHHATQPCDLAVPEDVARQLDRGVFALFHLCKALMGAKRHAVRVLSLFAGAPLGAAIAGFLKTLALEAPSYGAKSVEIAGDLLVAEKIALIQDELRDREWHAPEVRYRDGARSVRALVPQPAAQGKLPLRRNGVYLLTGGLGGLGIIFAEYLAKNYQARLVLTGRSAPNARQQAKIDRLKAHGAEVLVLQADVTRRDDVERVVRAAKERFLQLHGVIHAAGVTRDAFLLRKTREEMDAVLAPKVYGTINLDLATGGESLDFFALFASVAGVTGNIGQCDYAFGNRFLDAFAESRARMRSGRTLSIDWPFWEEGGMRLAQDDITRLERQTGMLPLPTRDGIAQWEELLRSDAVQAVALYGIAPRIAAFTGRQSGQVHRSAPAGPQSLEPSMLAGRTEAYLKAIVGEEIQLAPERIGSFDPLESFGMDSVMINRINARLETDLGELPKTLFYEHETVRELAAYLVREAREALLRLFGTTGDVEPFHPATAVADEDTVYEVLPARARDEVEAIAIIGMHGDYPHSATLEQYWENLKQGRDLIDPVPANRWDSDELYHPDPAAAADGKIYCKWGGFLEGHDHFDPHFFKISTTEAAMLDPQERLFLQSVWAAIEDAGYTRDRLRASCPKAGSADVGVFVGVTTNSYSLWAPEERVRGNYVNPTSMPWSIANRVSYFFDFNGPSLPVDTACSSSLVALHLACESLRNRECQVAVAGGVNLYLHPAKYHSLCQKRMLAEGGKCYSYGAGDDGFVPGEGVGTVVLKPLSRAIADRDRIHAVIRASAFDHSGRSNGYSAPNPNAQAHLISRTLEKARIHPETIGYVEGHGTGTQLGDSIEVAALTKAFRKETTRRQFCPLGSVKANIGHSESAAGIAGLAKVVLQMQHGQLAPSIHSDVPNPNIEFETSPFYLQHRLSEWQRPADHPRRALINSFGAGGLNACLVVEEYNESHHPSRDAGPYLFTLSAKNEERLHDYADRLLAFVRSDRRVDLASLCYTLQTGREAMEERLAIVVGDVDELIDRLGEWSVDAAAAGVHRGSLRPRRGSNRSLKLVPAAHELSLDDVASQWVAGDKVDWDSLYFGEKPRRIAIPTYPFARERYWLSDTPASELSVPSRTSLHPLIAYNSSTLDEVRFSSSLPETAFCAADHKVGDEGILPGAAFLEMACFAANMASEQRVRKIKDVMWMQPLSFRNGAQTLRTVLRRTAEGAEYVTSSFNDDHEQVIHSEGRLVFGNNRIKVAASEDRMTPQMLKTQCSPPEPGSTYYDKFRSLGLNYGPSFQTIQEIHVNHVFALSKLKIADELKKEFGQFILHPSMIDGALQTIAGLVGGQSPRTAWLPFALDELEILGPVPQTCYAYAERADAAVQNPTGVSKFNIRLLNESGETLIKLKNLYVRPLAAPLAAGHSPAPSRPAAGGRLLSLSGGAME